MTNQDELAAMIGEVWNPLVEQVPFMKKASPALIDIIWPTISMFSIEVVRAAMREEIQQPRPDIRRIAERCADRRPCSSGAVVLANLISEIGMSGARYLWMDDSPFFGEIIKADRQEQRYIVLKLGNARRPDAVRQKMVINTDSARWGWKIEWLRKWTELVKEYQGIPDPMIALRAQFEGSVGVWPSGVEVSAKEEKQ